MSGFLRLYESTTNQAMFLKTGYWKNFQLSIVKSSIISLIPFITPRLLKSAATVTTFELLPVTIFGTEKIYGTAMSINISFIKKKTGTYYDYFYYEGNDDIGYMPAEGIYEIKITLSDAKIIYSDPFFIPSSSDMSTILGDFNVDFGNDFYNY